jgi:putative acetyltransferase
MELKMEIREDHLEGAEIIALLQEHVQSMREVSPPESAHVLDLQELCEADITFWSIWQEQELLGCGALKELDVQHGEIKSMRTATNHTRKGVASRMLEHIVEQATNRAYQRLSLETGSMPEFAAARALYARYGFEYQGPFANYKEDPHSVFMLLKL